MTTTLRGDPARLSLAELRSALESGAHASAPFLRRLAADPRRGARTIAAGFRRRERERAHAEVMLAHERRLWAAGFRLVAGVDEAGMGPLAGPIVAAAVILSPDGPIPEAEDSKALSRAEREDLLAEIREAAVGVGLGVADVAEIAEHDVYRAGLLAMRRAVAALHPAPDALLVDARTVPAVACPQEAHVKGDATSRSIAAASIVAKVERDALMAVLAERHPGYGFEKHAGYATPEHLQALRELGPCEAHRTSWAALAEHAGQLSGAFYELREQLRAASDARAFEAWRVRAGRLAGRLTADEARRLEALARRRTKALAPAGGGAAPSVLPFGDA